MQLRYFIYIIWFLIISFLLNIFFYFISSDYRNFLKEIKSDNVWKIQVIYNTWKTIWNNKSNNQKEANSIIIDEKNINNVDKKSYIDTGDTEDKKVIYSQVVGEIKETKIEKDILNKFREFKLKKLELHPRLFDLTTEYPNKYIEYYSEYLTLYFFGNEPYEKLKDVFNVLTYELPFSINEVNNFWNKSFYINLNKDFNDNQIRIVFLYKNRTFWVKVSKKLYSIVKEKLERLK